MGVWKKLNSQDAFITSYVAKKQWSPSANEVEDLGIKFLPADNTYRETDCKFRVVNCAFELRASSRDCSFRLQATKYVNCDLNLTATLITQPEVDCTLNLEGTLNDPNVPTTPTPTPTSTGTPTPTPTLDCTLDINGEVYDPNATPTPTPTVTPTGTPSPNPDTPTPTPTSSPSTNVNTVFLHIPN